MTGIKSNSHPIFGNSQLPLYVQCANIMRQRINDGIWPLDTKLPSIDALIDELSVSRITIRQAISMLKDEGLVLARRGKGTTVIHQPEQTRSLKLSSSFKDLVNVYRGDIPLFSDAIETKESPIISKEEGKLLPEYTRICRVHMRGEIKYCFISLYVDNTIFQQAPDRFRKELALPVLSSLDDFRYAHSWQKLKISKADIETSKLLDIPVGEPTAQVRRLFSAADNSILYLADITYRGDYIELEMEIS